MVYLCLVKEQIYIPEHEIILITLLDDEVVDIQTKHKSYNTYKNNIQYFRDVQLIFK